MHKPQFVQPFGGGVAPDAPLLFVSEQITFQEVPDEIALSFLIAGCPLMCRGCHSADSWSETARQPHKTELTAEYLQQQIDKYRNMVSCVLFLGGEWHIRSLLQHLALAKQNGLKTCLYTGLDLCEIDALAYRNELLPLLDYLKTGRWQADFGGLGSATTNQKWWRIQNGQAEEVPWKHEL